MKYRYFKIGKPMRVIETPEPITESELHDLVGTDLSFVPLTNGNTICVNSEGIIGQLPYNRNFTQEDVGVDIEEGLRGNILEGKVDTFGEFIGVE